MRRYGASAMAAPGELKAKVNFLAQLAGALENMGGYDKEAYEHYLLAKLIRTEQNWKISPQLIAKVDSYDYSPADRPELLRRLQSFWMAEKHAGEEQHTGLSIRSFPAARPVSSGNTAAVSIISVQHPCIGSERKKGEGHFLCRRLFRYKQEKTGPSRRGHRACFAIS